MRVLSLWQPWATLCVATDPVVARPPKEHETRHWRPRYALPLPVAIHATKRMERDQLALLAHPVFTGALERCGFHAGDPRTVGADGQVRAAVNGRQQVVGRARGERLPLGAIVGVAVVVAVWETSYLLNQWALRQELEAHGDDITFGDWTPNRFAWQFAQAAALPTPIPFSGRQEALYEVPPGVLADLRAQLPAWPGFAR